MPKFEVYVRMPTFVFDTDKYIEADVAAIYTWEKTAKGKYFFNFNDKYLHLIKILKSLICEAMYFVMFYM